MDCSVALVLLFATLITSSVDCSSQSQQLLTWYLKPESGYNSSLAEQAFDFWERSSNYGFLQVFNPNYADVTVRLVNATAVNYSKAYEGHANSRTREIFLYIDRISKPGRFLTVAVGHVLSLDHSRDLGGIMFYAPKEDVSAFHRRLLYPVDQRLRHQCGLIDSIAFLNRTFVLSRGVRLYYYQHARHGSDWRFLSDHFGINITKLDAVFQFSNGTFGLISNDVLWNNVYTDHVFKNDVVTALNITGGVKTAGNVRDGVLFVTFNGRSLLLYGNDTIRTITMYPFPSNAIGVFDNGLPGVGVIRNDLSVWHYEMITNGVFLRTLVTDFGFEKWFPKC